MYMYIVYLYPKQCDVDRSTYLQHSLVQSRQQQHQEVERTHLLLDVVDVRYAGERQQVLPCQQGNWEVPGGGGGGGLHVTVCE